jgi:hypothetical protein
VIIAVNHILGNLEQAVVVTTRINLKVPVVYSASVPDLRAISVLERDEKSLLFPLKNPHNILKKDLD